MATYVSAGYYTLVDDGNGNFTLGPYNTTAGELTFSNGTGNAEFSTGDAITLTFSGGTFGGYIFTGNFTSGFILDNGGFTFAVSNDPGLEGTLIETPFDTDPFPVCFLAGTLIATPEGGRAIEDLAIGDMVLTADGQARPVRWIGRQTITSLFADALRCYPIRIAAGALGDQMPERDLFVSPEHALLVDGLLATAGALVNGSTVTRVARPAAVFTYYHVELEDHALILAEGVPAETFVDNVTRRRFDNWAEHEALYGTPAAAIAQMELPRVKSARQLPPRIRNRLAGRAAFMNETHAA